jgi:arylformamidase
MAISKTGWIDITIPISNDLVHWPGDEAVNISRTAAISAGDEVNLTTLSFSAHTGTHIDAPLHYIEDGSDITQIDPDRLIGAVKIFHITDARQITFGELKELPIYEGDRIFFRTRNSDLDWSREPFMEEFVGLSSNAAKYLARLGIKTVGVDYLSVASPGHDLVVHQTLLSAEICIIEGLDLRDTVPGQYEMVALPLSILGADGAPARVFIRRYYAGEEEKEIPV